MIPALECDLVRSRSATAAAVVAESSTTPVPVLVLCSGEFFMFTSAAAAECNSAAAINALSTPADDGDDRIGREWGFTSDDVMQPYDVSGDSMTSQRDMEVGGESRLM